jgi:hypothetical protein
LHLCAGFGVCGVVVIREFLVRGGLLAAFAVTEVGFVEFPAEFGNSLILGSINVGERLVLVDD